MPGDVNNTDVRVLGRILAAQSMLFVLPTMQRIAEFYAKLLATVPGVRACRVCLGNAYAQEGEFERVACPECEHARSREEEHTTPPKNSDAVSGNCRMCM